MLLNIDIDIVKMQLIRVKLLIWGLTV